MLYVHICVYTQSCLTLCNLMDHSHQAPLSMECSRQEYWSRLPFPTPGDLPNPGIKPTCPAALALADGFFATELPRKPREGLTFSQRVLKGNTHTCLAQTKVRKVEIQSYIMWSLPKEADYRIINIIIVAALWEMLTFQTMFISAFCCCFLFVLAVLHGMWDLSSPTRDQTHMV